MFTQFSRALNAFKGMGNAASASWTSSMAGKTVRDAVFGGWGKNVRNWGLVGAGGGVVAGAAANKDNRVAGAIEGGLLGAGAGMGGAAVKNNLAGLKRLGSAAVEGARRSW